MAAQQTFLLFLVITGMVSGEVDKQVQTTCDRDEQCPHHSFCNGNQCACKGDLVGSGTSCELAKPIDCSSHEFCGPDASCIDGKCRCRGKTVGGGEKCRGYQSCPHGKNYCRHSKVCLVDPLFPERCAALDECERQGKFCPRFSTCEKSERAEFDCVCLKGFRMEEGPRGLVCKDINECEENQMLCSGKNISCNNKVGRYECVCKNDLRLNWEEKCVPLNKCDIRGENCPYESHCKEIALDSYRCVCNAGFKPVEVEEKLQSCEDINECLTGGSICSGDRCRNTVGSYTCIQCLPGFIESKHGHCIGKMKDSTCYCDPKTEYCKNRRCVCKVGYKRNTEGHCILPPGKKPMDKQKNSAHSPLRSHVSVLPFGLLLFLIFTTTATSAPFPHPDFSHAIWILS